MNNKKPISFAEAEAVKKTLLSTKNVGPPCTGIMGAHWIDTYITADGRTLVNEFGNGGGEWYFVINDD